MREEGGVTGLPTSKGESVGVTDTTDAAAGLEKPAAGCSVGVAHMSGSGFQPPGGVTGLSAKMRRSSMGVTGLPGGVPDGEVTGEGDQGEVGQKK